MKLGYSPWSFFLVLLQSDLKTFLLVFLFSTSSSRYFDQGQQDLDIGVVVLTKPCLKLSGTFSKTSYNIYETTGTHILFYQKAGPLLNCLFRIFLNVSVAVSILVTKNNLRIQ